MVSRSFTRETWPRTLFSMSDKKPKIHVFMGAPRVPTEQGEEDPPGPWRTMELRWHGDKLRPRTAHNTEKDKEEQYPATSTTTEQPAGSSIGQEEQFIAADGETHVFMGAPPRASATPASLCEAGEQGEEGPPGPWRTMELCWHGGKLRPRTAQSTEANQCTHRTTTVQDVQQDKENQHPTSSTTTEQPARSVIIVQEDDHLITTEEAVLLHAKKADQSRTAEEEEEPCSESIHEYLDSCFPLGQPDPEPPNPTERRVSPSLSIQTDFLCSWTHSQALMLRGRHAGQSGHSPDKTTMTSSRKPPTVACSQTPPQHAPQTPPKQTCTPPPQTPPKQTFTPPPQTPSKHATTPQKNNSSTSPELYSAETFTPTPTPPCPETPPKCTATTPASVSSSTPELYSPEASTQSPRKQASCHPGSMELFSEPMMASLVVEAQGGVILEVTPDGLLCSQAQEGRGVQPERGAGAGTSGGEKRQEGVVVAAGGGGDDSRVFRLTPPSPPRPRKCLAKSRSPPSESPDRKRARMSPKASATEGRPEQPVAPVVRCETSSHAGAAVQTSIMLQGPTTLLVRCVSPGVRYSVLVVVVHPCHLKEVQVKRGVLAGTSIPLASIVVTDQSGVEMKVVLWRQAAFWALTVYPGDLLLITGVEVNRDKWRGETVLQTTFTSRLLNLGQITATSSPPVPQNINGRTLQSLCVFVRERRPLLAALPPHARQNPGQSLPYARQNPGQSLPYARLRFLRANTLVHALLRVSHTHNITAWQSAAEGWWRSAGLQKAVLTVEQADGQQGSVVLWGAALDWLPCINRNKDAVWDFRVLLVRDGSTSDLPELHSTPWGSVRPLAPSDSRARDFLRTSSSTSIELDLQTLLSQKYTGDVELRVQIMALQFQGSPSQNAPLQALDSGASLEQIAETLNGDVTYTGCGRCAVELDTDANGIYCPCYPCLPHTTVRRYFRPAVLTVREADSQLCVQVPAIQLQKMLLNTPPDKLHKTVAPGSEVRHIQLVSERVLAILSPTRRNFLLTVRSHFLCDENSVPMAQDFLLLDFSSQER